jgi:L-fuconolactonase
MAGTVSAAAGTFEHPADRFKTLPPGGHVGPRPAWLALTPEPVLEPDLAIVDPHHHLWERAGNRYLMEDILEDVSSGHNVVSTVFLECRAMYRRGGDPEFAPLGETEFVAGIAAMSESGGYGPCRIAEGIVGFANLLLGDRARAVLEAQMTAGGGRFRGVRHISAWHPDPAARGSSVISQPGILTDAGFRKGFAHLAPLGLSFDAWMYFTQLGELEDLAAAFPQTTIVLDHVGGALGIGPYAGKRDETFEAWHKAVRRVAAYPNVHVKLGGLGMPMTGFGHHECPAPPSSEELARAWRPYLEACIAAFGPERSMFESNFPVDKASCSYLTCWNAFKRITAGASADEKRALYAGTAARVYRLRPVA